MGKMSAKDLINYITDVDDIIIKTDFLKRKALGLPTMSEIKEDEDKISKRTYLTVNKAVKLKSNPRKIAFNLIIDK